MDKLDADYAPESPDLTAVDHFSAAPPDADLHPQHQQYRGSVSHINIPLSPAGQHVLKSPWASGPYHSQSFITTTTTTQIQTNLQSPTQIQLVSSPTSYFHSPYAMGRRATKKQLDDDADYAPGAATARSQVTIGNGSAAAPTEIEVKTKFPVARIKRIMQADEEVGKVAQVTPVVVSKALELFMISLVTKAAAEAKERSSKKVAAAHLKAAVVKHDQFDFLNEIVGKVAEAPAGKGAQPVSNDGDSDEAESGSRKKRPAARRRKKEDSEE